MSDEDLYTKALRELGDKYDVSLDDNNRVIITDKITKANQYHQFSIALPNEGQVTNCFGFFPGTGDYISPHNPYRSKNNPTRYNREYYYDSVMSHNDNTATFVVNYIPEGIYKRNWNNHNPIDSYDEIMSTLGYKDINTIASGHSNGNRYAMQFADRNESNTVILFDSHYTLKNDDVYYKNLKDRNGQVLFFGQSLAAVKNSMNTSGRALNKIVKNEVDLYVIIALPETGQHGNMMQPGMNNDVTGFVLGNTSSGLAVNGEGNEYQFGSRNYAYYRYDYNKGDFVPITPTEMQYQMAHYDTYRYGRLDYLRRLPLFDLALPDFTSQVSSSGKTVVMSNYSIAIGYLNEMRASMSTTNMLYFPNISGGFNAVTEKIESLVDTYVNASAKMYDKAIDITQKTRDVSCGYVNIDDAFAKKAETELKE